MKPTQSSASSSAQESTATTTPEPNTESPTSHRRLSDQWIAFQTLLVKEFLRFIRIWVQTVFPPVITTSLYFLIFGGLIGSRIGEMEGFRYIDFIVPGLIMLAVITNSYSNVVSSFFSAKFQRHIEEILVSPTSAHVVVAGFVGGGVARGILVGLAVTIIAFVFAEPQLAHPLIAILLVTLTATLFSLAGLINGVFARTFDDISIVPTFVLTPLTYLGGVFYSISLLPTFWQTVSYANPILYMVDAFRYALLGSSDLPIGISLTVLIVFNVLLYVVAWQLLERGTGTRK